MVTCIQCHTTDSQKFYLISPNKFKCGDCYTVHKSPGIEKQHLPLFERWVCLIHNCGSYNFNTLSRHEMPWCEIVKETTVGIIKPKTFGGVNGNITRHYFRDWQEQAKRTDMEKYAISAWKKFTSKRHPEKVFTGKKHTDRKVKNRGHFVRGLV